MTLRIIRVTAGLEQGGLKGLELGPDVRSALLAEQCPPHPVVWLLAERDLALLAPGQDLILDCGLKDSRRGLASYLVGPPKLQKRGKIGLIRASYSSAGRCEQGITRLLAAAALRSRNLCFLVACDAGSMSELWPTAGSGFESTVIRDRSPITDPDAESEEASAVMAEPAGPGSLKAALAGSSRAMVTVRGEIYQASQNDLNVLLVGETGTGKGIAARLIHENGRRRGGPFRVVNCAEIPSNLLESTLFGHERGAYTDAKERREGLFQAADHGTLFLDEIHTLTREQQAKLLNVVESGMVRLVGGTTSRRVDARIISATNENLPAMVAAGTFARDLYFRLNTTVIRTPPLRGIREDIPVLANFYWKKIAGEAQAGLPPEVLAELGRSEWLGNVRELRSVLEGLHAVAGTGPLRVSLVRAKIRERAEDHQHVSGQMVLPLGERATGALGDPDLFRRESCGNLNLAGYAIRSAQIPLRGVEPALLTGDRVDAIAARITIELTTLERLCRYPQLLEPAFNPIRRVKAALATFLERLPAKPAEALAFWKGTVDPACTEAFTAIHGALERLSSSRLGGGVSPSRLRSRRDVAVPNPVEGRTLPIG